MASSSTIVLRQFSNKQSEESSKERNFSLLNSMSNWCIFDLPRTCTYIRSLHYFVGNMNTNLLAFSNPFPHPKWHPYHLDAHANPH